MLILFRSILSQAAIQLTCLLTFNNTTCLFGKESLGVDRGDVRLATTNYKHHGEEIMKNTFRYIFVSVLLFSFACKENSTQVLTKNGIHGNWLLQQTSGGIGGGTTYPNSKYLVQITEDNTYTESRNDTVVFSGKFNLYTDSTYNKKIIDFIDSKRFSMVIEKISIDSLVLWDGFVDGYFSFYTRTK